MIIDKELITKMPYIEVKKTVDLYNELKKIVGDGRFVAMQCGEEWLIFFLRDYHLYEPGEDIHPILEPVVRVKVGRQIVTRAINWANRDLMIEEHNRLGHRMEKNLLEALRIVEKRGE